jgi:hypothetical protein
MMACEAKTLGEQISECNKTLKNNHTTTEHY